MESVETLLAEWNDPHGYRDVSSAEDLISALDSALNLIKEDMETIDRMPFQSIGEVADFAGESLAKHAEFMRATQ